MSGGWAPGIGDPSMLGWITVVAYLGAAVLCWLAAGGTEHASRFWRVAATTMLLLGINKQLDLQTVLTQIGRDVAQHYGWYAERRLLQVTFILGIAVVGALAAVIVWREVDVLQRNIRYAYTGLIFVFTYVVIRASSFHHVDIFMNARLFGLKWNWIIELSGIAIVAYAGLREWRGRRAYVASTG